MVSRDGGSSVGRFTCRGFCLTLLLVLEGGGLRVVLNGLLAVGSS